MKVSPRGPEDQEQRYQEEESEEKEHEEEEREEEHKDKEEERLDSCVKSHLLWDKSHQLIAEKRLTATATETSANSEIVIVSGGPDRFLFHSAPK